MRFLGKIIVPAPLKARVVTAAGPFHFVGNDSLSIAGLAVSLAAVTNAATLKTAIDALAISGLTTTVVSAKLRLSRTSALVIAGTANTLTALGLTAGTVPVAATVDTGDGPFTIPAGNLTIDSVSVSDDLSAVTDAAGLKAAVDLAAVPGLTATVVSAKVRLTRAGNITVAGDAAVLLALGLTATTTTATAVADTADGPFAFAANDSFSLDGNAVTLTDNMTAANLKTVIDALALAGMVTTVIGATLEIKRGTPFTIAGAAATLTTLGLTAETVPVPVAVSTTNLTTAEPFDLPARGQLACKFTGSAIRAELGANDAEADADSYPLTSLERFNLQPDTESALALFNSGDTDAADVTVSVYSLFGVQ